MGCVLYLALLHLVVSCGLLLLSLLLCMVVSCCTLLYVVIVGVSVKLDDDDVHSVMAFVCVL